MCGISGIFHPVKQIDPEVLTGINQGIAHRGPDSNGVWISSQIGLGHRRLAIIDTSDLNTQPLHDTGGRYVLVYNGEVYNYLSLRNELISRGAVLKTQGDSEVILEAYKAWGTDCLKRLEGMFAFAIWDDVKKTLFCGRDRMGKKPFFYAPIAESMGGGIAFASEPQALVRVPGVDRKVNKLALKKYLTLGYSIGEETLWKGVKRLMPGHAMSISREEGLRIWEYYDFLSAFSNKTTRPIEDAAEELRGLLDDCTATRLQSDVPFGVFLSAGLDSNSVLASMVYKLGARNIHSFSIGFPEKSYDESSVAGQIATLYGTDHNTFVINPSNVDLESVLNRAGNEPLADASIIATYELARHTSKHVKMVLTGDGGDELFAGYPTYVANVLHNRISPFLPAAGWKGLHAIAEKLIPPNFTRMSLEFKLKQFLRGLSMDSRHAHFSWRILQTEKGINRLLQPDVAGSGTMEDVFAEFEKYYERAKHLSPLDQALYVDAKTWMVDGVLAKVDRATMAHGVEARSPFLDHRMAEFAATLPDAYKLKGFNKKHVLKKAMRPRLPEIVFNQPKRGFSVPISSWIAKSIPSLALEVENDPYIALIFDRNEVKTIVREHVSKVKDHGLTLFNILVLSKWLKQQEI